MDIKKDFTTSFDQLRKHKVIIVPILLSLIVPLVLIFAYLYISGLYGVSIDLVKLANQYDKEKKDYLIRDRNLSDKEYTKELIGYLGESEEYKKGFSKYAEEKGFDWSRFTGLINRKNIILLIVFILIIIISSFYLSCASYALITLNIKNKELNFSNTIKLTNRFLLRLLSLKILLFFIILMPILLAILILISFFFIGVLLGGISILFFIILIIAYLIFIGLRLFFAMPIMFVEDKPVFSSIKQSYHLTKHHLKQVFVIFAIIYGITLFVNSVAGSPLYESFSNLMFADNIIKFIITFLIVVFFLIIESFMLAFEHMFLFYSYIDFKEVIK